MDLGDKDCAIVIKEDMSIELIFPDIKDDSAPAPGNMVLATALAFALEDGQIMNDILDKMDAKLEEYDDKVPRH